MKKRQLIIFAIILVVVVGASAAFAIFLSQQSSQNSPQQNGDNSQPTAANKPPAVKTSDDADKLAADGDVQGGVKKLDDAIKTTDNSHDQFIYYSQKATLLFNDKNYAEALVAATQAYNLEKTSDSAAFVGQIARAKGDTAMALDYYKKALNLIDSSDPYAKNDRQYYQGIVNELEGGK